MIVAVQGDILSLFDLFRVNAKTTSEMTKKNRYRKFFFAVVISTLCRFYQADKKSVIYASSKVGD